MGNLNRLPYVPASENEHQHGDQRVDEGRSRRNLPKNRGLAARIFSGEFDYFHIGTLRIRKRTVVARTQPCPCVNDLAFVAREQRQHGAPAKSIESACFLRHSLAGKAGASKKAAPRRPCPACLVQCSKSCGVMVGSSNLSGPENASLAFHARLRTQFRYNELRFEVPMQTWKKIAILGAVGAGAAMLLSGRRALGAALTTGGLALLASEYPEKFEDLVEDAPEYLNKGIEFLATLKKVGGGLIEDGQRRSANALRDMSAQFGD